MEEDNNNYQSEDLHNPINSDDEGNFGIKATFPQHDEFAGVWEC